MTVDSDTTVEQCEEAASCIAAMIRTRIKVFGGHYRIWVSDSLPGHKLKISVWYNHNTNGAPRQLDSTWDHGCATISMACCGL